MPTNEERREVAARLRKLSNDALKEKKKNACELSEAVCERCDAFCTNYVCWSGTLNRLADLIEPEPERNTVNTTIGYAENIILEETYIGSSKHQSLYIFVTFPDLPKQEPMAIPISKEFAKEIIDLEAGEKAIPIKVDISIVTDKQ